MIKNDIELKATQDKIKMLKNHLMDGLEGVPANLHQSLIEQRLSLIIDLENEIYEYRKNRHAL